MIVCAVLVLFFILGRMLLTDPDQHEATILTFDDYFPGSIDGF